MNQTIYDRIIIIFSFGMVILALMTACSPPTAVSPQDTPAPTEPSPTPEQYAQPLLGELTFEERPSNNDTTTPTIDLILINATLQADDERTNRNGGGLDTPHLNLYHCKAAYFDGDQLFYERLQVSSRARFAVLMHYAGANLSGGGDNSLTKILTEEETQLQIPLALDTAVTFYTINLTEPYEIALWQGEQSQNSVTTSYQRPISGQPNTVTASEAHTITIIRNVPIVKWDPGECE